MKYILLLITTLSITSCVYHSGQISSTLSNTQKNIEYVDMAVGYSKYSCFFGMGGYNKDAFLNDAKRNLYRSYPLQNGQSFENLTLDVKTTLFIPYKKVEVIITADVVQGDTSNKITYHKNYSKLLSKNKDRSINYLTLNDSVCVITLHQNSVADNQNVSVGKIIGLNKKSATVAFINYEGVLTISNKKYGDVFKINNLDSLQSKVKFIKEEKVKFSKFSDIDNKAIFYDGTILALNRHTVLLDTKTGLKIIPYSSLQKL